jgi:hypothetical protein
MSWKNMNDEERGSLLARASLRGLPPDALSSEDDLIVEGRGVTLSRDNRALKSTVITARSLDELIAAIGPSEVDREAASTSRAREMQRHQFTHLASRMRSERRSERPGSQELARRTWIATSAAIQGVLTRSDLEKMNIDVYKRELVPIVVQQWLFTTIVVRSGAPLVFDPLPNGAGVHSLVAYKLIIEPNAGIVINRTPVSIDCVHLEIQ